jgi:histidine triad (HIT) family protein
MTTEYPTDPQCIFCRIIAGKAPAKVRYESGHVFAFDDINPHAPTHVLICPKAHYLTFMDAPPKSSRRSMPVKNIAAHLGFGERGFRLQVNNGRGRDRSSFTSATTRGP